jgi:hypothetical protein
MSAEEISIMKRFTGYIADFTKYGKPTHGNSDQKYDQFWRPYEPQRGVSMIIDKEVRLSREVPFETKNRPGRIQFWLNLLNHTEDVYSDFVTNSNHDEL